MEAERQKLYDEHKQHAVDTAADTFTVYGTELMLTGVDENTIESHALMTLAKICRELQLNRPPRQTSSYIHVQLENRMANWANKILKAYRRRTPDSPTTYDPDMPDMEVVA